MTKSKKCYIIIFSYIFLWMVINSLFLTRFPFFHSDEIWLAGLTRTVIEERTFGVTEPFFDLFPRTVHGLRIIFHSLQALFVGVFRYSVFGVRALSLFSGAFGLMLFFNLLRKLGLGTFYSFLGMFLLSADIQYIYGSHFGRQEILIVVFMLAGLNMLFHPDGTLTGNAGCRTESGSSGRGVITGLITGLAAGVHPNAFIAAWPAGLLYLVFIIRKKRKIGEGLLFLFSAAVAAGLFVAASFILNPDFLAEYSDFGISVGVRTGTYARFTDFIPFIKKLFFQVSGTYYTPDIRGQILLIPPVMVLSVIILAAERAKGMDFSILTGLIGIAGVTVGLIIVGKYSQPSVIFYFPFIYILIISLLSRTGIRWLRISVLFLAVVFALLSVYRIGVDTALEGKSFEQYNYELRKCVPPDGMVLGNLNTGLAVEPGKLLDWRNLPYLEEAGLSVEQYIRTRKIEYIIIPEELDYIYNSRPVWNIMYGNLYPWYEGLNEFIKNSCIEIKKFKSPGYAMRITSMRFKKEWDVTVYRVLSPSMSE